MTMLPDLQRSLVKAASEMYGTPGHESWTAALRRLSLAGVSRAAIAAVALALVVMLARNDSGSREVEQLPAAPPAAGTSGEQSIRTWLADDNLFPAEARPVGKVLFAVAPPVERTTWVAAAWPAAQSITCVTAGLDEPASGMPIGGVRCEGPETWIQFFVRHAGTALRLGQKPSGTVVVFGLVEERAVQVTIEQGDARASTKPAGPLLRLRATEDAPDGRSFSAPEERMARPVALALPAPDPSSAAEPLQVSVQRRDGTMNRAQYSLAQLGARPPG